MPKLGGANTQCPRYSKQLPIYTWVELSNNSKVPYSRTQPIGHSGARIHNLMITSQAPYPLRHTGLLLY